VAVSPVQPVRGVSGRVRLEETGCEQAADLRMVSGIMPGSAPGAPSHAC